MGKTRLLHPSVQSQENPKADETLENVDHTWCLADFELGKSIEKGCSAVVYSARMAIKEEPEEAIVESEKGFNSNMKDDKELINDKDEFPLAIKMMFNYHAESNAFTILRAMQRLYHNLMHNFKNLFF